MYEFRNKNVCGATAFGTYSGFWFGLGRWVLLVAPNAASPAAANHDLSWILLAFAIFNTYMLLWSSALNKAVFAVFLTLEITEIVLFIGFLSNGANTIKIGGYVGIVTAAAWYASAAGVISGIKGRRCCPSAGRSAASAPDETASCVIPGTGGVPGITCTTGTLGSVGP